MSQQQVEKPLKTMQWTRAVELKEHKPFDKTIEKESAQV
jgi:hypothetical protein